MFKLTILIIILSYLFFPSINATFWNQDSNVPTLDIRRRFQNFRLRMKEFGDRVRDRFKKFGGRVREFLGLDKLVPYERYKVEVI